MLAVTQKSDPSVVGLASPLLHTLPAAERLKLRREQSAPLLAQLHDRLLAWKQQSLPKHSMAEAITYALGQWQELNVCCSDGAAVSVRRFQGVTLTCVASRSRCTWLLSSAFKCSPTSAASLFLCNFRRIMSWWSSADRLSGSTLSARFK
jgi:hypothetical protein